MTRRRTLVLPLLLFMLASCAIAARGASAEGLTAFTCFNDGAGEFDDAHCVSTEGGEYALEEIPPKTKTEIDASNEKTAVTTNAALPTVLKGEIAGTNLTVECSKVSGSGYLENVEKVMHVNGAIEISFSECSVPQPAGKCVVKEPIVADTKIMAFQNKTGFYFYITPKNGGETFLEFTLEDKGVTECPIKGKHKLNGNAETTLNASATGKGATPWFTAASSYFTLDGEPATLEGPVTLRKFGKGLPITFTTTEP